MASLTNKNAHPAEIRPGEWGGNNDVRQTTISGQMSKSLGNTTSMPADAQPWL